MRVELDRQLLLRALLEHLNIKEIKSGAANQRGDDCRNFQRTGNARLVPFPAYASPTSVHDPQYELRPEEKGKTSLQLLQMALMRVVIDLDVEEEPQANGKLQRAFSKAKESLIKKIKRADATQQPVDKIFSEWMKKELRPEHYWEIQTRGMYRWSATGVT
jgi:hypothetical protein